MNILIIGNADSVFVKNYVDYILVKQHHTITILSPTNSVFSDYYMEQKIRMILLPAHESFPLRILYSCKAAITKLRRETFDVIHIHFVSVDALILNRLLKKKATKSIVSFWGSDLFRAASSSIFINRLFLPYVDLITLSTKAMYERFLQDYGAKFSGRLRQALFGNTQLELISSMRCKSSNEIREELGLPQDKFIFAVGYNKIPQQQHINVLDQIVRIPSELRKKIHLVLRLTYGNAPDFYMEKLCHSLKNIGCTYTCYTAFMTDKQIALLEMATDVFIHAQTTDAFSATVQEHLYAGALVMNPSWIPYLELKNAGIFYLEYNDFEQLGTLILDFLENKIDYKVSTQENATKIYALSSWNAVTAMWQSLYD